jgi:hypothetical protein
MQALGCASRVWLLPAYKLPLAAALGVIQVLLVFMPNLHLHGHHVSVGFDDLRQALWESPTAFLLISLIILTSAPALAIPEGDPTSVIAAWRVWSIGDDPGRTLTHGG